MASTFIVEFPETPVKSFDKAQKSILKSNVVGRSISLTLLFEDTKFSFAVKGCKFDYLTTAPHICGAPSGLNIHLVLLNVDDTSENFISDMWYCCLPLAPFAFNESLNWSSEPIRERQSSCSRFLSQLCGTTGTPMVQR